MLENQKLKGKKTNFEVFNLHCFPSSVFKTETAKGAAFPRTFDCSEFLVVPLSLAS